MYVSFFLALPTCLPLSAPQLTRSLLCLFVSRFFPCRHSDAAPPPRRDTRYDDRPYMPAGGSRGDYGPPPPRGGDPYGGRPPRREAEIYATPASGFVFSSL